MHAIGFLHFLVNLQYLTYLSMHFGTLTLSHGLANAFLFCVPQVIYEMTQGERQLIEDLNLVKKVG